VPAELTPASTPAHFEQARALMLELMEWDCSQVLYRLIRLETTTFMTSALWSLTCFRIASGRRDSRPGDSWNAAGLKKIEIVLSGHPSALLAYPEIYGH
jgi:hypothetical protein